MKPYLFGHSFPVVWCVIWLAVTLVGYMFYIKSHLRFKTNALNVMFPILICCLVVCAVILIMLKF